MAMSRKAAERNRDRLARKRHLNSRQKQELMMYNAFLNGTSVTTKRDYTERGKGGGDCCFRQLAKGKRRLGIRLAQRWVKLQFGVLVPA